MTHAPRPSLPFLAATALVVSTITSACGPSEEQGQCSETEPCETRGEECNLTTNTCEEKAFDPTSTEDPAEASFTDKVIPFFRGEVCTVLEAQSGTPIPVTLRPCFHPCIDGSSLSFKFKHSYQCIGSTCDADALLWVTADGNGCPADAFGEFPKEMCTYPLLKNGVEQAELDIGTTFGDGNVIRGSMLLEIPFLTNEDAGSVLPDPSTDQLKGLIEQYPQLPERIVAGQPISILPGDPVPPADCSSGCECFEIGF